MLERLAHLARHLDGIGARRLVDADRRRWRAVVARVAFAGLGAEIDARHVLHSHDRSVGVRAHHNVLELFGPGQPALGRDGQLNLLLLRRRRRADAAQRGLHVLALHGGDHIRRCQVQPGQAVGIEPQPQRIIERPEQARLAYTANAG